MNDFEDLFDKDTVEHISGIVESKMTVLNDVKDFKEKDKMLSTYMDEMDQKLPEELKDEFDDIIRLMYQLEQYYFTLAYMLGSKYEEKKKKL